MRFLHKRTNLFALGFLLIFSLVAPFFSAIPAFMPSFFMSSLPTAYAETIAEAATADDVDAKEAVLRAELAKTEAEIAEWTTVLNAKRQETGSIQRDTEILAGKIEQAKLVIKAKNLAIQNLGKDIVEKEQVIGQLDSKIGRGKESLSELIRKTNEIDSYSVVEVALSNKNLSDFFADLDSYSSIKVAMQDLFHDVRSTKTLTEAEKQALNTKKNQETDAKAVIETQKSSVEKTEAEKQALLKISKTQEKTYEQVLADRQKKAAQIRSALFALRDTAAIPFGTALSYANEVSKKTGVRPAFILAILTQESNLGKNVGQCYVKDPKTGDGVGKNTGTPFSGIMHPTRDVPVFLALAARLGFDPYTQPVSCPQPGGYGGAMGPSQFIPSTWVTYESRVAAALGTQTANPWSPKDAFMATGLFVADLGGVNGSYTAEREAAGRYYAGGAWATRGLAYADSVLNHAKNIQETMIDPLQGL